MRRKHAAKAGTSTETVLMATKAAAGGRIGTQSDGLRRRRVLVLDVSAALLDRGHHEVDGAHERVADGRRVKVKVVHVARLAHAVRDLDRVLDRALFNRHDGRALVAREIDLALVRIQLVFLQK